MPKGMPVSRRGLLRSGAALAAGALGLRSQGAQAAGAGVTADEIRIGSIFPYSGPASAYGVIGKVQAAWFRKVNDAGGVNGRRIRFISYDDAYNPARAVEQTRRLVESDDVLAVFNPLGVPSNTAIRRYLNDRRTPQLFVASGATKWGDWKNYPWTISGQPSYQAEAQVYARMIRSGRLARASGCSTRMTILAAII